MLMHIKTDKDKSDFTSKMLDLIEKEDVQIEKVMIVAIATYMASEDIKLMSVTSDFIRDRKTGDVCHVVTIDTEDKRIKWNARIGLEDLDDSERP